MRVAIFTDTYVPQVNGVARTLKRWTDFLDYKHVDYRVFAPETSYDETYSEKICKFMSLPFWLYPECRLALPKLSKIRSELETFHPDLIHIATPFNIGLAGQYYGKKMNIPLVGSYHTHFDQYLDYYGLSFLSPMVWKYMHWFHQPFQKTFVPSVDTKEQLEEQGFSDIHLWTRGVDGERFHPHIQSDWLKKKYQITAPYLLTFVGRLAPEKGLDVLMDIAHRMPASLKEKVHWLIVGDGPLFNQLKQTSPENMTFTGYQDGRMLTQIYASSSLFVFPSSTETFGNVVLESLACGTPAVVSNSGGVTEIVTDYQTGRICNPGDVDGFIRAIQTLTEHPLQLNKMSLAARQYALTQTWEKVFEKLLFAYEETIENLKEVTLA